jgi:1-acyl-sn-glycerol-3-phosphate acyltransferase
MNQRVAKLILKIGRWETEGIVPNEPKVLVTAAPHTSKVDFFWAMVFYASIGGKFNFLVRKEQDFWPFNRILEGMGGIRLKEATGVNFIKQMILVYDNHPKVHMAIAPEGTTKLNPVWSAAFHVVAKTCNVPVYMSYLDYKKRLVGITASKLEIGESASESVKKLYAFYDGFNGKIPQNFTVGQY